MNEFLQLNPEFTHDARLIKNIARKTVFKDSPSLDDHLSLIKLPLFKKLLYNHFYKSEALKKTYEEIIQKESNGVEKMIFRLLCGQKVSFSDITLKFLFYREFPDQIHLFENTSTALTFQVEDLLFRSVYLHEDTRERVQRLVEEAPFLQKVFFIISLKAFLSPSFTKDILFAMRGDSMRSETRLKDSQFFKYWALALRSLPEREVYAVLTSDMLYSSLVEKVQVFRAVEGVINHQKLSLCLLAECFNSSMPVIKIYLVFLKVIEMFRLSYAFRLKLLYSWARYFLYEGYLDLFSDLVDKMKKVKRRDTELEFYCALDKYLREGRDLEVVRELMGVIGDSGQFSAVTTEQIAEKYKIADGR